MAEETPPAPALSGNKQLRHFQIEEARAKKDSAVAAARKAEAEVEKAKQEPEAQPSSKAPEGKATLGDDVGLVADLVAHSMLDEAADKLGKEIADVLAEPNSNVLLVDSPDLLGADWPYLAISKQIEHEKAEIEAVRKLFSAEAQAEEVRNLGAAAALAAIPGLIGGVADVVSMFRGDYEIKARKVSIGTTPLFAALANRLIARSKAINLEKFSLLKESTLLDCFNAAALTRLEVQRLATEAKEGELARVDWLKERAKTAQASYDEALKAAKPPSDGNLETLKTDAELAKTEVVGELAKVADDRANVAVAEGAIERFDAFAAAITKAPESGYPPLIAAAVHEALHEPNRRYTHVLYAAVESAGGETITRQTIFRTTARFIGGAQVSYLLWDVAKEELVAANTMPVLGNAKFGLSTGFTDGIQTVPLKRSP